MCHFSLSQTEAVYLSQGATPADWAVRAFLPTSVIKAASDAPYSLDKVRQHPSRCWAENTIPPANHDKRDSILIA